MVSANPNLPIDSSFQSETSDLCATISNIGSNCQVEDAPKELIIIITGNPGLVNFYYDYAQFLHNETQLPVWTIGHAGHSPRDQIKERTNVNNLDLQLRHKIEFIEKYTSPNSKIHLIGHSVGGWMCTEILECAQLQKRICSVSLLYPTLEFIADTPNGYWLNNYVRYMTSLIFFAVYLFIFLPKFLSRILVHIYFFFMKYPRNYIPYVYLYLQVPVIQCCLGLAFNEMDKITDLNLNALSKNIHRIKVFYAENDGWAPGRIFRKIQNLIPELNIQKTNFRHAFVMGQSKQVAEITAEFIKIKHK